MMIMQVFIIIITWEHFVSDRKTDPVEYQWVTLILAQFGKGNFGLTIADATGLHLMAKHHIQTCWSTDFHLGLTGVPLVISEY